MTQIYSILRQTNLLVDTTFLRDIIDNVLDDLVILYSYCWTRVSILLDRIYCFEPARAIVVYEYYCELIYMTKIITMMVKLRRIDCFTSDPSQKGRNIKLYEVSERGNTTIELYIKSLKASNTREKRINLDLVMSEECNQYVRKFDSTRLIQ